MSFGAVVPAQAALTPQLTKFEMQGSPDGTYDWNDPYGPGATPYPTSGLLPSSFEFRNADRCGSGTDDIFASKQLDKLVIDNPDIGEGQSLDKGDLCAAYAATELVAVGGSYHTILYGAWEREPKGGQITFFIPLADGVAGNNSGDRLIEFDYDPSGTPNTSAYVRLWDGNSWERGPVQPASVFEGAIQPGKDPAFGEFALDLTAAGVLPEGGPCTTLTEKYAFSQTGQSDNATLKDYVDVDLPPVSNCSTLIVDKVATPVPPAAAPKDFGFTVSQTDGGKVLPEQTQLTGTLKVPSSAATHPATGNPVTINDVLASPDYVVKEDSLPAGWTQESLVCTGTDPLTGETFTKKLFGAESLAKDFPLGPGQTVTCTITNLGPPSVSVTKTVLPASVADWSVDFTIDPVPDGEMATKTATSAAPTVTWNGLMPGTEYEVTEGAMPGFAPGAVGCAGDGNSFTPTPGQAVSCAVTNTKLASVSATKTVLPADSAGWTVNFTISPVPEGETATKAATPAEPTVSWVGLLPETAYTVTEGAMPGFVPGTVACDAGSNTFTPEPGDDVSCAVTNIKLASVSATKTVLPAGTSGWSVDFTISPVPAGETATKAATAAAPTVMWNGLLPGTPYTVTEGAMPGFVPGTVGCAGDGNTFTPTPGQAVSCAVTNAKLATVSATKSVLPAATAGWAVDFTISPVPAGQLGTKTATGAAPTVTWEGLLPGTQYTVTEGTMPGFGLGAVSCSGGSGTFTPTPGEAVSCAVTNTKLASVSATKTVLPAGITGWSVDFTITPVPADQPASRTATAAAPTVSWDGLVPGTQYTITEAEMPGFTSGLVTCDAGSDAFIPAAGQVVSCEVTNTAIEVIEPEEEVDDTEVVADTEDEIAATGANSVPMVAVGLWLALIGAALVLIASRRRRA